MVTIYPNLFPHLWNFTIVEHNCDNGTPYKRHFSHQKPIFCISPSPPASPNPSPAHPKPPQPAPSATNFFPTSTPENQQLLQARATSHAPLLMSLTSNPTSCRQSNFSPTILRTAKYYPFSINTKTPYAQHPKSPPSL